MIGLGLSVMTLRGLLAAVDLVPMPTGNLQSILKIGDSEDIDFGTTVNTGAALASAIEEDGSASVFSTGRARWPSTAIAILMGARDVTLGAFELTPGWPGSAVDVTFGDGGPTSFLPAGSGATVRWDGEMTLPDGSTIAGELRREAFDPVTWTFFSQTLSATRSVPPGAVFHCTRFDHDSYRDRLWIVAVGRNNQLENPVDRAAVHFDTDAILARQIGARPAHLVISIVPGRREPDDAPARLAGVHTVTAEQAAKYGERFIDANAFAMDLGPDGALAWLGYAEAQRRIYSADVASGIWPSILYGTDDFHPDGAGYFARMKLVPDRLGAAELNWLPDVQPLARPGQVVPSAAPAIIAKQSEPAFVLRQASGLYGQPAATAARDAAAKLSGNDGEGVRITVTAAGQGLALDFPVATDPGKALSAAVLVRPSETCDLSLVLIPFDAGYPESGLRKEQINGNPIRCPAGQITPLHVSGADQHFTGQTAVISIANDAQLWLAGSTLDVDDFVLVPGSALP